MSLPKGFDFCNGEVIMGISRKKIVQDQSLMHVTFRTHNGAFYFESDAIKAKIVKIIAKYKPIYGIKIFDWVIMSNHVHLTIFAPNAVTLGDFMRSSNKTIADLVNKEFNKTGQAIADRYKSPMIESLGYAINTIGYIWLNPVRAGIIQIVQAQNYNYCSLFFKYRGLKDPLADSYKELMELSQFDVLGDVGQMRFVIDYLNELKSKEISKLTGFCAEIYEHTHSIGGPEFIKNRSTQINFVTEDTC